MKRTTLLILLLMLIGIMTAEVYTIGDGASTQNYIPIYGLYDYSWSKVIYTASELGSAGLTAGQIDGLGFQVGNTPSNYATIDQRVYIRHTTAGLYAAEDNTLPDNTAFQQVYNAGYTWNGTGWHYLMFITPFMWNGTDNIEIVWENWDGTYVSGYPNFNYTATTDMQAVYKYTDNSFPGALTGTLTANRPNIQIVTPSVNPPGPANLVAPADAGFAFQNTTLSWSAGDGMPTSYNLYLGTTTTPEFLVNQVNTSYSLTDLLPGTTYYWQVIPQNANGPAANCPVWSFSTPAEGQLAESFEIAVPPSGWASQGTANWTQSTSMATDGTASAYKYGSSSSQFTLSTPMLTIAAGNNLTFDLRISTLTGALELVYSPDRENWTVLQSLTATTANAWQNYVVDLSAAAGNNYIGFRTGQQSASFYLDSVIGPQILPLAPNAPELDSPDDLAVNQSTYPVLEWDPATTGGVPTSFNVYLDTAANPTTLLANTTDTSYALTTALNYDTTYYWKVTAVNALGESADSSIFSFTTMSNPTISAFPWTVDFGTETTEPFPPLNWNRMGGQYPNASGTSSLWGRGNWLNGATGNNDAKINIYGTSRYSWLITPPIAIPATGYEMKFNLGLTDYYNSDPIEDPEDQMDDKFIVLMSDTPTMANPVILREWNNSGSEYVYNAIPNTGIEVSINLSDITGTKYFAFYGESTVSGGDNDLHVDNVTIREIPSSPLLAVNPVEWDFGPTIINGTASHSFVISNSGSGILNVESVVLAGEYFSLEEAFSPVQLATGETTSFNVQYMPTVVGDHTGTAVVTAGTQVITVDLSASCFDPIVSTFPWNVDFGTTTDEWPVLNWTQLIGLYPTPTGVGTQWVQDDWLNDSAAANKAAKINIYGTTRYGWLVTPPINMSGNLELSFDAAMMTWNQNTTPTTTQEDDRFLVIVSDNQDMSNPTILREWNNTGSEYVLNNIPAAGENYSISLTGLTGVKYLAFYGESTVSGNGDNDFMVDNVSIDAVTETPIFAIDPASYDFGDIVINNSASQTFTISNAGSGSLGIQSIAISGSEMMSLAALPTLPATLAAGASISFDAVYAPTATGDHNATITINDNINRVAHNVALSGTALPPAEEMYPPSNLQAAVQGNDVHLSWNAPEPPPTGEWITWCDPSDMGNGIGTNGAAQFDVAHRFDATDLLPFQGSTLTHVQIVPNEVNCVYTLKIWTGTSAAQPSTMVHSQAIPSPVIGEWNTIELSTPVAIPATGELWIGYGVNTQAGHPAGCDDGPQIEGKGNMMNFDGWDTLTGVAPTLTYNWSIQGYVDHEYRALTFASKGTPALANTRPEGTLAKSGTNRNVNRDQTGYKIYRDGTLINTISNPETLSYIDADLELGTYNYTLTAAYDSGESEAIGPVSVTISDLIAPLDLAATVEGNDVTLNWTSPVPPLTGEWITWCNVDALGNSIGTNAAATFDVAHMYDATDLAAYQGGSIAQIKFVPVYQPCTYTVKVWTGGTATAPANLVYSAVHENPTLNDWNLHVLSTPIPVPSDRLWIGYGVNTQGGHPAGCDDGPQIEGKGNMMNFGGWTTLSQLNADLVFNWSIQGFVADGATMKAITPKTIVETPKST
ncbi:MAG: choice-of-anchor D domain-containing protein, partial [Candidatus Cloacimonetes bacterium]|nr:choice-of-anchor D domain-containing protein [Candidatus Cloacimonadota bacterium]